MPYKAVYKNKSGQILEIEIITEKREILAGNRRRIRVAAIRLNP